MYLTAQNVDHTSFVLGCNDVNIITAAKSDLSLGNLYCSTIILYFVLVATVHVCLPYHTTFDAYFNIARCKSITPPQPGYWMVWERGRDAAMSTSYLYLTSST